MVHPPPPSQRPRPTPKPAKPNTQAQDFSPRTLQGSASSFGRTGNTEPQQTRGTSGISTQKQHRAIDFVKGRTTTKNNESPPQHPEEPARERPQTRSNTSCAATSKKKKKACPAGQKDGVDETKAAGLATSTNPIQKNHELPPNPAPANTVQAIQQVETRDHLGNDVGVLEKALYRFEASEAPQDNPPPAPPQFQPPTNSAQPVPQLSLPTDLSQLLPGLPQPDPGNLFSLLEFYQGATKQLLHAVATKDNSGHLTPHEPSPRHESLSPREQVPEPPSSVPTATHAKHPKKIAKSTNPLLVQGRRQRVRQAVGLSTIPRPKDTTKLDVAMGLEGRYKYYVRIQNRVRKIMLNSGYDWTVPWTKVALNERGALCQMVRQEVPYMARFEADWATARLVSQYAAHLRSEARKHGELAPDPRYSYLKNNSAKRRKDAPRGARPGLVKGNTRTGARDDEEEDSGRSRAGPSINTVEDEEMMDAPELFGIPPSLSNDEDESGCDGSRDPEGRE